MERIRRNLIGGRPAYTLILYGTNDWNAPQCQDNPNCEVVPNLRTIVETVKAFDSLPVIGTLIPANPALDPPGRNQWITDVNTLVKSMAASEGAVVADLNAAFLKQPNLPSLYSDHLHPNDTGYQVMAQAWFDAITHGRIGASSAAVPCLFTAP